VAPPFKVVDFDISFGSGIDRLGCLLDAAEATGVVQRRGAYYQYGEVKLGQGRAQAAQSVRASPGMEKQISAAVMAVAAVAQPTAAGAEAIEGDREYHLGEQESEDFGLSDGQGSHPPRSSAFRPTK
jgi:hypothetical protein